MTRIFCFLAVFFAVGVAQSQDLADRIPADAIGVVKINTPRFFESVGVDEFSQSTLGEVFMQLLGGDGARNTSIGDYGIALDRAAYLYGLRSDSVRYSVFLWPVSDAAKLQATLFADKEVDAVDGYRRHIDLPEYYGQATVYTWNETVLTVVSPKQIPGYFDDEEVASRYGLANRSYSDFYHDYDAAAYEVADELDGYPAGSWDDLYRVDTVGMAIGSAAVDDRDTLTSAGEIDTLVSAWEAETLESERRADPLLWEWDDHDTTDKDGEYTPGLYEDYVALSETDRQIKDSVLVVWTIGYAHGLLTSPAADNLLRHTAFTKAMDAKAIVSVWLPDFASLYGFAWPELFNLGLGTLGNGFPYYGDMRVHVYADKDLRIASTMEVGDAWAAPIKRMYDQKINRKFFRYINSESMLGMYGFATNTEAILEELPGLVNNAFGSINGPYQEETALATAILSVLLDEAAIARAVRGDGLFVLNGLEEREVPYTYYDWDEDYNMIEVDSVQSALVPDFLFMLSSDDRTIYDRVVSYLASKGHVLDYGRIVEVNRSDMPFGVFMAHHRGILFVGSSAEKLEAIVQNRYRGKMTRGHRRMLRRHTVAGMFSVANAAEQFDNAQLDALESYVPIRNMLGGLGEMQYKLRMRGNSMEHEFVSRTPSDYPNAIQQIMSLMDFVQGDSY